MLADASRTPSTSPKPKNPQSPQLTLIESRQRQSLVYSTVTSNSNMEPNCSTFQTKAKWPKPSLLITTPMAPPGTILISTSVSKIGDSYTKHVSTAYPPTLRKPDGQTLPQPVATATRLRPYHILDHCRPDLVHIRERHNKLVKRITDAIRFSTITTDRTIVDSGLPLRPDIVVEEDDRILIIDVTCPFDNGADALDEAAQARRLKYHCVSTKKRCEIYPFVVGPLGSGTHLTNSYLQNLEWQHAIAHSSGSSVALM